MIIDWSEQGTDEWYRSRMGIPTASAFGKIMTPTGKKSSQSDAYMNMLVAEWLLDKPQPNETFGWMDHGNETEAEARDAYEFISGNEVVPVGVVYKNAGRLVGCSPDALLTSIEKGCEIKCPAPHTHISYLLANGVPSTYIPQVQGSMYVTGYKEWDFVSYHPEFPPLIVTVKRDDDYIKKLDANLKPFIAGMIAKRKKLMRYKNG